MSKHYFSETEAFVNDMRDDTSAFLRCTRSTDETYCLQAFTGNRSNIASVWLSRTDLLEFAEWARKAAGG